MLSEKKIHRIGRIDQLVRNYFDENPSMREVAAKELMPLFINKGIFVKDHREGLPIMNILRELDREKKLYLLKYAKLDRKNIYRNWYFAKPSIVF